MLRRGRSQRSTLELIVFALLATVVVAGLVGALLSAGGDPVAEPPPPMTSGAVEPATGPDSPACHVAAVAGPAELPADPATVTQTRRLPGGSVQVTTTTSTPGITRPDESGSAWTVVSVTSDAGLTPAGLADISSTDLPDDLFGGETHTVDVTVPTADLADLRDWLPPSLLDPLSLPEGGAVLLSAGTYADLGLDTGYRALRADYGSLTDPDLASAVVRLAGTDVRVLVGPRAVLATLTSIGRPDGLDTAAALVGDLRDEHVDQADFGLGTPSGREAYFRMLLAGRAPTVDGNGVSDLATLRSAAPGNGTVLPARLDRFIADLGTSEQVATSYDDGRVAVTGRVESGSAAFTAGATLDADGRLDPRAGSATMQAFAVDEAARSRFDEGYADAAGSGPVAASYDLSLHFDAGALTRMGRQARAIAERDDPADLARDVLATPYAALRPLVVVGGTDALESPDVLDALVAWQEDYRAARTAGEAVAGPDDAVRLVGPGTTSCRPSVS